VSEEKANMTHPRPAPQIRVGPVGWSYADWNGTVYPSRKPRGFHEAGYLAQFFDTIEINTSFYQPLRPDIVKGWISRVEFNPNFRFTAKLWQRFTHERQPTRDDERIFKQGLRPLAEAGRLGALLMQFPWSFKNTPENRAYLGSVFIQFLEYPLVIEVRHSSWNEPEIFELLAAQNVGFCNIDQPVIGPSLAPSAQATAPVGYVRLHGRNYEQWFTAEDHPEERYNYLYSHEELAPWAGRIQRVAERADAVYVVTNNHFRGKAVANALQLVNLLTGQPVRVPPTLLQNYPELADIAAPTADTPASEALGPLFGNKSD
jgi:uncharacterized protein YecE (DUF72 family)